VRRRTRTDTPEHDDEREREQPVAAPLDALRANAGNAAFSRWIARQPKPRQQPRVSYVFLMGEMGDPYYRTAREYFEAAVKGATVVIDKRTLAAVIAHVNSQGKPVDTLYLVSHAGDSGFLQFSVDDKDLAKDRSEGNQKPNATYAEIKEANDRGTLPKADVKLIDEQTKIKIKGCDIGRSVRTLDELDEAFGGKASVTAPTHAQEFRPGGGRTPPSEHLARMYVEWPGEVKKNARDLAAAFKAKYPMVPEKRWKSLLPGAQKDPHATMTMYEHQQPKPIDKDDKAAILRRVGAAKRWPSSQGWVVKVRVRQDAGDWVYEVRAEKDGGDAGFGSEVFTIPVLPTDTQLIDREKAKHGRPDAAAWRVKKEPQGDDVKLTVLAERTEWFINGTVEDAKGPIAPAETDADWYTTSTFAPPPPPPKKP
jgi:hypothetical protein